MGLYGRIEGEAIQARWADPWLGSALHSVAPPDPTWAELAGASFRRENTAGALLSYAQERGDYDRSEEEARQIFGDAFR